MGLLDRFSRNGTDETDTGDGPISSALAWFRSKRPQQKALTPREIEELHAKLYPGKTEPYAWGPPKPAFDPLGWQKVYTQSLEDKFAALGQRELEQAQRKSPLFQRLPQELRLQIWRHVIGGQKLYFTAYNGRLVQAGKLDDFGWWPKRGLLTVALLCRIAYFESIACLYSSNTFCIGFGHQGTKFPLTAPLDTMLPKQHVASIRHMEVGWHLIRGLSQYYDSHPQAWDLTLTISEPDLDETWGKVCTQLLKLSNLQSLKIVVWISGSERDHFAREEKELLTPLTEMRHLKSFSILLPWVQDDHSLWKDAPFTVSREFENRERFGVSVPLLRGTKQ